MKLFSCSDYPIEVHGLVNFQKSGSFERLSEEIMQKLPNLRQFGSRSTGGRITFKTDTKKLYLKLVSKTFIRDVGTTQIGSSGIDVYIGDRKKGIFIGSVYPTGAKNTDPLNSESTFSLPGEITDVTVFMPKNEIIENEFHQDIKLRDFVYEISDLVGVDPDMALSIACAESGYFEASIATSRNNPYALNSSNGFIYFDNIYEGITEGIINLKENYIDLGLTTYESITSKYCPGSTSWSSLVRGVSNELKNGKVLYDERNLKK